jgi:hypothetical protein
VPLPHRYQVFSVGVEHLLLLRKGKLMLPLRQKQKERPKLPLLLDGELPPLLLLDGELPLLEELEKLPPLDGGLPLLGVKLNGDVENKRLPNRELPLLEGEPNRELPLLEGEPNRELPLLEQGEFAEDLVEFVELLGELENPDSVGLDVGLEELSDVVDPDLGGVGLDLVGAVSLPRHL